MNNQKKKKEREREFISSTRTFRTYANTNVALNYSPKGARTYVDEDVLKIQNGKLRRND